MNLSRQLKTHSPFFISLVLVVGWVLFVVPQLLSLPEDFVYSAEVLSLDNFYDETARSFEGEQRSVTQFSYTTQAHESQNVSDIENVFSVRTVSGEPIFSVARRYGIDRASRQHVPGYGDKSRTGYLFGPRMLGLYADTRPQSPFTYWHINYDAPTTMVYVGTENIGGVVTYRYESNYQDATIDQTNNLMFLPGVGETRGVNLDPYLELWIEPLTGSLVKYHDETIAYYYDIDTGERLHPWNKFSNTYQQASLTDNIALVKAQKMKHLLIGYWVPLVVLVVGLVLVRIRNRSRALREQPNIPEKDSGLVNTTSVGAKRSHIKSVLAGVVVILVCFLVVLWFAQGWFQGETSHKLTVGISRWVPDGNPAYDTNIQGFKDALEQAGFVEGVDVEFLYEGAQSNADTQRAIAQQFIEQNVDLVYSLTTPGTQILKERIPNKPIVFSIVTYPVETGLIESLTSSGNNLVGTRNWVSLEEQFVVFREIVPSMRSIAFIHRAGEANSGIQLTEMEAYAAETGMRVVDIAAEDVVDIVEQLNARVGTFDVIYSACDTLVQGEGESAIIAYAHEQRIPSFSCNESGPLKGDVAGVVADFYEIGRLAGEKASLVLSGVAPNALETNTVARPRVYVNQRTARHLDILIPQDILAGAKEIIK